MAKKVVITGGSGFLGSAISWQLLKENYDVVSLDMIPPSNSRVMYVEANLVDGIPEHRFLEKPNYYINLAGAPIFGRWTAAKKEEIYESRINSTNNLIEFIANPKFRPEALISASATGFYGDSGTVNVTERSDAGTGFLARVVEDWEASAKRAESLGVRTTIIRNATVMGTGGMLSKLLPPTKFGLVFQLGEGQNCFPWIHEKDLVNLYHGSMIEPHAPNVINAVAPHITTIGEFYRELAALRRAKVIQVPKSIIRPLMSDFVDEITYSQCVRSDALSANFKFKYPTIKSALKEILRR